MKTCLALLALIAPAYVFAQEQPQPQPAESQKSFRCRVEHTPEVRQCVQGCESSYQKPALADQRWDCIQLCTVRGLWAMAECRHQGNALEQAQAPKQAATGEQARDSGKPQALEQAQASR